MTYLDYRTNEAADPETLDDMEGFISRLSPIHQYTMMLMLGDAIASEDYAPMERTDLENGDPALNCPYCGDCLEEITHLTMQITATPADFTGAWDDEINVHHRMSRPIPPFLTWQCPECLHPVALPEDMEPNHLHMQGRAKP